MNRAAIARYLAATLPFVDPAAAMGVVRADANETLVMARQLEHFYAKIYEYEYPEAKGRKIIPIDTSVPSGARAHTYKMFDDVGNAAIIDDYADDLPNVDAKGYETAAGIVGIGDSFTISIQDLRSAAMMGVDIDTRKATGARKIMERKLDALIAGGDSVRKVNGFASDSNVTQLKGAGVTGGTDLTGNWATATAAQIQADVEKIGKSVFDNTLGVHGDPDSGTALTLVLPTDLYSRIASLRIDTFNTMTVLKYILENNPFVKEVTSWARLNSTSGGGLGLGYLAGATSGGSRAVAFHRDPDVVSAVISQDFEMLPMQPKSLSYKVPCHMRFGGTVIRFPKALTYADGL